MIHRCLILFLIGLAAGPLRAADPVATFSLKLPAIISDHMVLQAGKPDALWGWAKAGAIVTVEWCDSSGHALTKANATADASGRWKTSLPAQAAGGAGELHVTSGAETQVVKDVLIGENWLCGGQSNMEFAMSRVLNASAEIAQANDPQLRLFLVSHQLEVLPADDVQGKWVPCTPASVTPFSAVGYYFGKRLRSELKMPVGLIGSYWGGTGAQLWMSVPALQSEPGLQKFLADYQKLAALCPNGNTDYQALTTASHQANTKWQQEVAVDTTYQAALAAWNDTARKARDAHTPIPPQPKPSIPAPPGVPMAPTLMFNGMIAPMAPFTLDGFTWFQADGNLGEVPLYGTMIKTLIKDWRTQWGEELPFYYVEMNNMRAFPQTVPVEDSNLALLRETQQAALELPKTGVVCSIDLGLPVPEPHFPNKKPVGDRLANLALNDIYQHPGAVHSPEYKSFQVEGNKIRLKFNYAEGLRVRDGNDQDLRVRDGGELKGFAIRAVGGQWLWAEGKIDQNDIVVWNDQIPQPADVRYAWASNPVISVENGAGLPLRPFRTDTQSPK